VVGAGVLKALQHTYKQRMRQVRHDVQRMHLQYSLQPLGRDEIVRDEQGQIHLQRRAVGVLKVTRLRLRSSRARGRDQTMGLLVRVVVLAGASS